MKKCILAVFSLGALVSAHAQSSVTMYGNLDLALQRMPVANGHLFRLWPSGFSSSLVGFRGIEDLGGGLRAGFWLEAGINPDDGTGFATNTNNQASGATSGASLAFNRRSTVSIGGDWGELRLGRDYTPSFFNMSVFDPFGGLGVGTNGAYAHSNALLANAASVRASNSITYHYGHAFNANHGGLAASGFNFSAMAYRGENASNSATPKDGNGYSVKVGYDKAPLDVTVAYGRTDYAAGNARQVNAAVAYNFGFVRPVLELLNDRKGAVGGKGFLLGATAPVGQGQVRVSFTRYEVDTATSPASRKFAVGYVHHLSKRTAAYANVARLSNSGGASVGFFPGAPSIGVDKSGTAFDVGIRHSF